MQIENMKAQAREDIARIFPKADAATREKLIVVYIAGAAYLAGERGVDEEGSRYSDYEYTILSGEVRNLSHASEPNAG